MKRKTNTGNTDKRKTRDWYRTQGYESEYVEHLQSIFTSKGIIYVKNDLFASDGVAMNGTEIVFWNSKGRTARENGTLGSALRKYDDHKFPGFVIREVVCWEPRKKNPYRLRTQNGRIWSIDCEGNKKSYIYKKINLVKK